MSTDKKPELLVPPPQFPAALFERLRERGARLFPGGSERHVRISTPTKTVDYRMDTHVWRVRGAPYAQTCPDRLVEKLAAEDD